MFTKLKQHKQLKRTVTDAIKKEKKNNRYKIILKIVSMIHRRFFSDEIKISTQV